MRTSVKELENRGRVTRDRPKLVTMYCGDILLLHLEDRLGYQVRLKQYLNTMTGFMA